MTVELTTREEQILFALADGLTLDEIAEELGLSRSTVQTYLKDMLHALAARNRAHAVALAYHHGILQPKGGFVRRFGA